MKKKVKAVVLVLSIAVLGCLGLVFAATGAAEKELGALVYHDVDMDSVADGTYYGETDAGLVYVKLAVSVKDHAIEEIRIMEHKNGLGQAAESILWAMVDKNDYAVDAVSGATLSSEAIKSAVSKALNAGQGE